MKVFLIKPPFSEIYGQFKAAATEYPPLGLTYIAAMLEKDGHEVKIIDMPAEHTNEDKLKKFLEDFKVTRKLPYKFSYKFSDEEGKISNPMIADWEIGELYWNCLKNGNEEEALRKVKNKYFDKFVSEKDIYFFLGTTKEYHNIAHNPFIIIGVYYPPKKTQTELNLI